ncbi:diaminopimelate decarboxylase LysA [Clostridium aceticum]|uniref:Diaminopimelate decarboxylase n=2 Tax=Clostridium aceticum TaxID=84022 RepID=A0A0D8IB05_9CLOT|nr:diaminopimelate decarboxylase [Clostridium aceticum]AKL96971.1 diaminopimelate decarboxylase LysA [Clostridium aceticum]KJF27438.1 diaminopimelate decarboxylase [Clostridium aceticum]
MENVNYENHFTFAGCDTVALAEEFGTPLYVVSEEMIRERCGEIRENFLNKYKNVKAAYASKAFLTMAMCKIIESEGLGLDVVSGGELYTAIKAGFPTENIMFHGNNKSWEELELAVINDVGRIIVDNIYELDLLEEITKQQNKKMKILFRVTPGIKGETHEYIVTGQKDSKFGIPLEPEKINDVVARVMDSENIELMGFHFHLGSQLFENHIYKAGIEVIAKLMKDLKEGLGFITKELNAGGGFGIRYTSEDHPQPLHYFTDAIMEAVEIQCCKHNLDLPTIIIEPGRWIVGEAGVTLYTIGSIKEIPNIRTYASIDGGLPDNPRPALYKAKYDALVANKMNEELSTTVTIAGKCCESGDILIWDLDTPPLEAGDILAVLSTGAYNFSMASNYNRLPRPAVVLINKEHPELIVERESYDHLLDREIIPSYLKK